MSRLSVEHVPCDGLGIEVRRRKVVYEVDAVDPYRGAKKGSIKTFPGGSKSVRTLVREMLLEGFSGPEVIRELGCGRNVVIAVRKTLRGRR